MPARRSVCCRPEVVQPGFSLEIADRQISGHRVQIPSQSATITHEAYAGTCAIGEIISERRRLSRRRPAVTGDKIDRSESFEARSSSLNWIPLFEFTCDSPCKFAIYVDSNHLATGGFCSRLKAISHTLRFYQLAQDAFGQIFEQREKLSVNLEFYGPLVS